MVGHQRCRPATLPLAGWGNREAVARFMAQEGAVGVQVPDEFIMKLARSRNICRTMLFSGTANAILYILPKTKRPVLVIYKPQGSFLARDSVRVHPTFLSDPPCGSLSYILTCPYTARRLPLLQASTSCAWAIAFFVAALLGKREECPEFYDSPIHKLALPEVRQLISRLVDRVFLRGNEVCLPSELGDAAPDDDDDDDADNDTESDDDDDDASAGESEGGAAGGEVE